MRALYHDDIADPSKPISGQIACDGIATSAGSELPSRSARRPPADARIEATEAPLPIAQQLVEQIAALSFYVGELQRMAATAGGSAGLPVALIDGALRETKLLCSLVERMRASFGDTPLAEAQAHDRDCRALRFDMLTAREGEVLELVVAGLSNKQGAAQMNISPRTFESHRAQVMRKLGARNAAQLIRTALTHVR